MNNKLLNQKLKLKKEDEYNNRFYECPVCGSGEVEVKDNVFYGQCDNCKANLIDYCPTSYQYEFHKSGAQYRLAIGAFGTGKTTQSCAEIMREAMDVPHGRTLITGPTLRLIKDAVIPELEKFMPPDLVIESKKNPSIYYKLRNGHEIVVYPSNDQENLRSLNLTAFYIEEASTTKYEIFDQLMTRLRHKAAVIKDSKGREVAYRHMGIISTNPEEFWGKENFLFKSSHIYSSPSVDTGVYKPLMHDKLEEHFHSFLSSTRDNEYLPSEFIARMTAGKDPEWIRVYVDCYLDRKEGAVYPDASKHFVEPFKIPRDWKRIAGFDPGFADPTAFIIGAIDPRDGCVYWYKDYSKREKPMGYHAREIEKMVTGLKFLYPIQADPSVRKRSDRDGISYADDFYARCRILLEPGNNDIMAGIEKVRDYMDSGKMKFFNTLIETKKEFTMYTYAKKENVNIGIKPIDAYNHIMDALRYGTAVLPRDPNKLNEIILQSEVAGVMGNFFNDIDEDEYYSDDENIIIGGNFR